MEEKKTVQYKRTMRGTMGAGASALFNGNGRRFYILEHRDASKYHKAGESQKIIVDQVELGRQPDCQVRFDDETWDIVSRRHAAIVRDNDRWKLVQLSQTNSTFLNGQKIETEWYLANGDEIQLAVNGPRLGFIVPEGKQGLVSSIKLTERLKLFQKQALAPYKRALWAMGILLILVVGGFGTWNIKEHQYWVEQQQIAKAELQQSDSINKAQMAALIVHNDSTRAAQQQQIDKNEKNYSVVRGQYFNLSKEVENLKKVDNGDWQQMCNPHVFYLQTTKIVVTMKDGSQKDLPLKEYGWSGTGFLLDDGRFVTAKHCIVGWQFPPYGIAFDEEEGRWMAINNGGKLNLMVNNDATDITVYFTAYNSETKFSFTNKNVVMTDKNDEIGTLPKSDQKAHLSPIDYTDWAYIMTNASGKGLSANNAWSMSPQSGTKLKILGYPKGYVAEDAKPLAGSCTVAHDGLDGNRITVTERNFESGNSGGPVILIKDGKPQVVGLVSGGLGETIGFIVPIGIVK